MLKVESLTKLYGKHVAVDNISFFVEKGTICGFIGPNGAGKTTTLDMITGCLEPTSGSIEIDGADLIKSPKQAKRRLSYLPDQPPLYIDMTPEEYLRFVARTKGVSKSEIGNRVAECMELTGISDMSKRLIRHLSKGYRQRVAIAQAALGDASVIVMDESLEGLDPSQIVEMREVIKSLSRNRAVLLSSHILSEVSAVCDTIMIINKGRLLAVDTPSGLTEKLDEASVLELEARTGSERMRRCLGGIAGVSAVEVSRPDADGVTYCTVTAQRISGLREEVFNAFAAAGIPLLKLNLKQPGLEDIYLGFTSREKGEME